MISGKSTANLLEELIRIPSKTTEEKKISDFIFKRLNANGVNAKLQGENVVVHIKGSNQKKALVFNGHIDTVATGPMEAWSKNPFEPSVKDGVMNGLGASDMKASVAVFMELAAYYSKNVPTCDLWFAFVVGEEVDGRGSQSFLDWFTGQPLYSTYEHIEALIGEPTNNAFLGIGHRGNLFIRIAVSSDSSAKEGTVLSEIVNTGELIKKLEQLVKRWKQQFAHDHLGVPSLGVTSIATSNHKCSLVLDIRTVPKLHSIAVNLLEDICKKLPFKASVELIDGCPAGWTEEDSELRQLFAKSFQDMPQQVLGGSADLCFFTERNIKTVIFGPGQREKMHAANESFNLANLPAYIQAVINLVLEYGKV